MNGAAALLDRLRERGLTVATAESLTGGRVVAALVDVPGASTVVRGGVVAYATDTKQTVLGVDAALLAAHGAVHDQVARQLAAGARRVLGADVGISTTGVAGPATADRQPVGRVFIGIAAHDGIQVLSLQLAGDREQIRSETVTRAIAFAEALVTGRPRK
ncbi:MAG: CinA family protein [Microbacterium sp.]|uniref:CinA family protein n=1 Tax=Microbacterium sp. TaxID=51671 RepID=UPI003A84B08F